MPRRKLSPFRLDHRQWLAVHSIRQLLTQRWFAVVFALGLTGLGAAVTGLLFKTGVGWLGSWRLRLLELAPAWLVLPLLGGLGGLVAGLLVRRLAPSAGGSGITQVMQLLKGVPVPMGLQVGLVKLVAGTIAIGSGFPPGPEGPSVQMGSSVGWQLSRMLRAPQAFVRVIVAAGGGAGIAAVFHAPIGGFFYAIEELLRTARPVILLLVITTTFAADLWAEFMGMAAMGLNASGLPSGGFQLEHEFSPLVEFFPIDLPYLVLLGAVVGCLAELYNRYVLTMQRLGQQWFPRRPVLRMVACGALLGAVYALLPADFRNNAGLQHAIGNGHVEISKALGIFALVFLGTGLAAGSGAPGGLFAPMLTLGGAIGLACGGLAEQLTGHTPTSFVFAGMGAFVAGCSRTPITAMFLAFTLTKNLLILKPILVACLLSFLVAQALHPESIYERLISLQPHWGEPKAGDPTADTSAETRPGEIPTLTLASTPLRPDPSRGESLE